MEVLKHLDLDDMRRWTTLEGITCRDCAHSILKGCANARAVLEAMRSRGNDMSIPVFNFTPDPDGRADQCPGMWPSEDYLAEIGATIREPLPTEELPVVDPVSDQLVDDLGHALKILDGMIVAQGEVAA
jgi:hypothetical protein